MRTKTRVLLPAGVLAAAILGTACGPPPINPPPTTPTTQATVPPPAGCAAAGDATPGPNSANPIASWGVDGRALASAIIGDVVYVGGNFFNAIGPSGQSVPRHGVAAFCLADGSLVNGWAAHFGSPAGPAVNALTTDGTSLFVGGDFTTMNGSPANRLVKLDTQTGAAVAGFAPRTIPAAVFDLDYSGGTVFAGGDFGKLGLPADVAKTDYVGNAAGFNSGSGAWTGWFAGAGARVDSIAVSPNGASVFIGGNFVDVKRPSQNVAGTARDRLAKLGSAGAGALDSVNYGALGARPFDLTVAPDNVSLFAAIGTGPGASGNGDRIIYFNGSGAQNWNNNNLNGNGEAVELIGNRLYTGFVGGYDDGAGPLALAPAQYRTLGIDFSVNPSNANHVPTGVPGAFDPATNVPNIDSGVFDLTQGANRLVAVGDFTSVGATGNLHGLAIFG